MRLTKVQVQEIKSTVLSHLPESAQIYLIGSRTKDHLKGGDIDLLIVLPPEFKPLALEKKLQLKNDIMKRPSIDDTRVDLTVATPEDLDTDPFISTLVDSMVLLN